MAKPLLPLCSIPTVSDKDGSAGVGAKFYLPFHGYWNPSGEEYSWPSQQLLQDKTMRLGGVSMPKTYQKDCCTCPADPDDLIQEPPGGGWPRRFT